MTNLTEKIDKFSYKRRLILGQRLTGGFMPTDERFGSPRHMCWAPDGSALLAQRDGYLWRIPADGSPAENLSKDEGLPGIHSVVSVDSRTNAPYEPTPGEVLVITSDDVRMQDGIARFNLKTHKITPLLEDTGYIAYVEACPRKTCSTTRQ